MQILSCLSGVSLRGREGLVLAWVPVELIDCLLVLVFVRRLSNRVLEHRHEVLLFNEGLVFEVRVAHQEEVDFPLRDFVPQVEPLQASVLKVFFGAGAHASREDAEQQVHLRHVELGEGPRNAQDQVLLPLLSIMELSRAFNSAVE